MTTSSEAASRLRRSRSFRPQGIRSMAQLDGKVAIITGAASGIGKEIAWRFATEGAKVVIADLQSPSAEAAAAELNRAGGTATGVAMDVNDEAAVDAGIAATMERFGRLDILVSNAGIQIVKPIDELPFAEWKKMLAIHLDGAFLTTKACLRHMYQGAGGTIIYIGSVHSKEASVLKAPYVTAKHGLIGFCKVVAKEIPEQAKALGISEEEVVHNVMLRDTVDGEFTTIDDVAAATLFFAAAKTNALTGQSLIVSHGWFME